jgi:hypothetical protein
VAGYERHRPEDTALHRVVREHLDEFLRTCREETFASLPRFIERAFRAYVVCGLASAGFTRLVCRACGHEAILAFSCKTRLLCPSCAARHVGDGAAHFLDRVLPDVAYRQIVVSLPFEVRGLLAFRPPVLNAAVRLIDDTVMAWQRRRAADPTARVGGISVLQRSGGALNIHPHVHLLVADGAWHEEADGTLRFRPTPAPTLDEVAALADRIARRLTRMLHRRGLTLHEDNDAPPPEPKPDPLAGCIQVALGLGHRESQEPALELASDEPPRPRRSDPPLCAIAQGVNVHAGVVVRAGDRPTLETVLRYLLRPPLSLERLSLRDDGAVVYRLQRPDRRGRTALVMTPLEFLARLAAILPAPRLALRRQLGVFSPGSKDRRKVMPAQPLPESCHPTTKVPTRIPWAELLRRVFDLDGLRCERCGGRLRPVAVVLDLAEAERYLRARGEFTPLPGPARSRGPPAAVA